MSISTFAQNSLGVTEVATSGNIIINGGFDIWQRGTSFTNPATTAFVSDRWQNLRTNGSATITRQAFASGELSVEGFGQPENYIRWQQTANSTSGENELVQPIENVTTLAGEQVTLSFWAKANKALNVVVSANQLFGTGGSATNFNSIGGSSVTRALTTSWQRFTITGTMASVSGKTIGQNSMIRIFFRLPYNDTYTFDIWGVQLEAGAVATPFKRNAPSIQGELAACQRYYHRFTSVSGDSAVTGIGSGYLTNQAYINFTLPVKMRTRVISIDRSGGSCNDLTTSYAVSSSFLYVSGDSSVQVGMNISGATNFRTYHFYLSGSDFIAFSAEL
jgi:hypothetical protein